MRITYLYNSAFALFFGDYALVFDYYRDTPACGKKGLDGGVVSPTDLAPYKQVYVFISHAHEDHFSPTVLDWQKGHPNLHYFLSEDVRPHLTPANISPATTFLKSGQSAAQPGINVQAYGSTDEGISFFIQVGGYSIFHAGDLNCWHWPEESTTEGSLEAIAAFEKEMVPIIRDVQRPDVAFFPVDPRMVTDYDRGAIYFAEHIRPKLLVPMHFRNSVWAPAQFANKLRLPGIKVWNIQNRGESIEWEGAES